MRQHIAITSWFLLVRNLGHALPADSHTGSAHRDPILQPYQLYDSEQSTLGPKLDLSSPEPIFPHRPDDRVLGFIALGDSYSAGIGTGLFNGTEDDCRHGTNAYPMLVHTDLLRSEYEEEPTYQFLSCTGSTISDMLAGAEHSQIDEFNTTSTADFALLSIGGNDLGFFDIMNSCIFRFYSFYSGTCEAALERADKEMAGLVFETRLRLVIMEILDRVRWEKRPWFTITVTGYAQFFNAETEECDDNSFGVWWRGPRLKRELRQRMNKMVLAVNEKIRRSVEDINAAFTEPRVLFVNYDDAFEGHRFCEPGVIEPDYTRNETWFFLVGGPDNDPDLVPQSTDSYREATLPSDSPFIDPQSCLEPAQRSGDWGQQALCMMVMAAAQEPTLRTADGRLAVQNSMWYVPTYYGKTFHPRTMAHKVIRDRVYEAWHKIYAKERGFPRNMVY